MPLRRPAAAATALAVAGKGTVLPGTVTVVDSPLAPNVLPLPVVGR